MNSYNCTLLIDDDDDITNYINSSLIMKLKISSRVERANYGIEAINFIKNFSALNNGDCPELILLDINLPDMDGFQFLEQFTMLKFRNENQIKIILLTASDYLDKAPKQTNQISLFGYIVKPLTEKKLQMLQVCS